MKAIQATIIACVALFTACGSVPTPDFAAGLMQREWVSFDIETQYSHKGEITYINKSHIILHNINDSTQEIALFFDEGESVLITPEKMTHIIPNNLEIAQFECGARFYDAAVVEAVDIYMDYFQMYYPMYDELGCTYKEKARRGIIDGDTTYIIKASKPKKECYSNGTCRLIDQPVWYTYSSRQKAVIKAQALIYARNEAIATLGNIDFGNKQAFIDSVFDLESDKYENYDRLPINTYYPTQVRYTQNSEMNDTVLDFPIIHLASGNTTTLRQMQGTTLLHYYGFRLNHDYYTTVQTLAGDVDNVVWLMPFSNNTERFNQLVEQENLGTNLYYCKGFTQYLTNHAKAFLINPDHKTQAVLHSNENTFGEWIARLKSEGNL